MLSLPSIRSHRPVASSSAADGAGHPPLPQPDGDSSSSGLFGSVKSLIRLPFGIVSGIVEEVLAPPLTGNGDDQEREARRAVLGLALRNAVTVGEWREAALELDALEGNNVWKFEKESAEYDWRLIESRLEQLEEARISCDPKRMLFLIRTALSRHLGGMGSVQLYKHSHIGTKQLIEKYIDTALETLASLLEQSRRPESGLDPRYLMEQLLAARQSFGRSALLLSGGGTFGMNHIGVVKCLWEAKLLPRIISGSSAGSIVCSVLCTRTDDELPAMMDEFCYGDLDVFVKDGSDDGYLRRLGRLLKHGSLFDVGNLIRVMQNLMGDMTFQEAYNRTRRILNICVSSASVYELPRLLNYLTAPNVIIWSAVQASCAVPGVFHPLPLLAKDPRTGEAKPWNPQVKIFIDGSVDGDLPMTRLAEMFNVNHFIVSQVNPHVVPFLDRQESTMASEALQSDAAVGVGSIGPTWLSTFAGLARDEALHRMQAVAEMGVFPNIFSKLRSILNQRYSGDITIFPEVPYAWFARILENPTTPFMLQANFFGERATWPQLSRIQNHCAIELALDDAVQQLRARIAFSPSQVDLRIGAMEVHRTNSEQAASSFAPRSSSKRSAKARHKRQQSMTGNELEKPATHSLPTNRSTPSLARAATSPMGTSSPNVANESRTLARAREPRQPAPSTSPFSQSRDFAVQDPSIYNRLSSVTNVNGNLLVASPPTSSHSSSSSTDDNNGDDDEDDYFTMASTSSSRRPARLSTSRPSSSSPNDTTATTAQHNSRPATPFAERLRMSKSSAGSTPYPRSPGVSRVVGAGGGASVSAGSLDGTGLLRNSSFRLKRTASALLKPSRSDRALGVKVGGVPVDEWAVMTERDGGGGDDGGGGIDEGLLLRRRRMTDGDRS